MQSRVGRVSTIGQLLGGSQMMQKMEMDLVSKVGASEGQGDNYNTSNSSEGLVAAMGKSCMLCLSPPCIKRKRDVVEVDEVETRASFSFPSVPAGTDSNHSRLASILKGCICW